MDATLIGVDEKRLPDEGFLKEVDFSALLVLSCHNMFFVKFENYFYLHVFSFQLG